MAFLYLPKPIYDALPVAYVAGGAFAAFWSSNVIGAFSGAALALAGLHVRSLRKRHRLLHERQRATMDARLRRHRRARVG
jgi:heme exporter protein D